MKQWSNIKRLIRGVVTAPTSIVHRRKTCGRQKVSIKEAADTGVPKVEAKMNELDDDRLAGNDWRFVDMKKSGGMSSSKKSN